MANAHRIMNLFNTTGAPQAMIPGSASALLPRRSSNDGSGLSSDSSGPWRAQASDDGRPSEPGSEYTADFESPRTESSENDENSAEPRSGPFGNLASHRHTHTLCNGSARDRRAQSWRCAPRPPVLGLVRQIVRPSVLMRGSKAEWLVLYDHTCLQQRLWIAINRI